MRGMPNGSFRAVITDPPYNTGMKEQSQKAWLSDFFNDSFSEAEYLTLVDSSFKEWKRLLQQDGWCVVFSNWKVYDIWKRLGELNGFELENLIVWDKKVHGLGSTLQYRHEFILLFKKGKPRRERAGNISYSH